MTIPENVHDLIGQWSQLPDDDPRPLHEFLGLTWEEYACWAAGHATATARGLADLPLVEGQPDPPQGDSGCRFCWAVRRQ